ncbi:4a-hydroxytetrahydrobiopterin dehydratase [Gaoshiqia sediminis]|uniref:4a-hydroxytetrahydrobiopterin dehydratase n=1 Tax=Gaoshiqia sediminis TaxID=2986998 RepID=A0AA42CB93_9BACT|nr:4a-hydroxytetrahydrobiopterin dehydratase [Gaoshiqia sediminis]MCW0484937.1 4a-hydroxytetrahydrobiopterin dehydratase [Gaoshiqia sediminis]
MMNWKTENNQLEKVFNFQDFSQAMQFVNKVGALAEKINHHPDILIFAYKKVKISLTTHSAGNVTSLDHELAEKIDRLTQ